MSLLHSSTEALLRASPYSTLVEANSEIRLLTILPGAFSSIYVPRCRFRSASVLKIGGAILRMGLIGGSYQNHTVGFESTNAKKISITINAKLSGSAIIPSIRSLTVQFG